MEAAVREVLTEGEETNHEARRQPINGYRKGPGT